MFSWLRPQSPVGHVYGPSTAGLEGRARSPLASTGLRAEDQLAGSVWSLGDKVSSLITPPWDRGQVLGPSIAHVPS